MAQGQGQYDQINPYTQAGIDANEGTMDQFRDQAGMDIGQYGMNQFMANAPLLYGMTMDPTSQFYQGQMDLGRRSAREGINEALSGMSGMGSLYSGAAQRGANQAAQNAMLDVTNQTNQFSAGLLNNLWGQNMGLGYGAGGQMAGIGAGLYGQGLQGVTGYGDPIFEARPSGWDRFMDVASLGMSAAPMLFGMPPTPVRR